MNIRRALLTLLVIVLAMAPYTAAASQPAGEGKAMPFNDQSVFNYFKNVEEQERETNKPMSEEEHTSRKCALFASVMKQAGYDFDATVKSAASGLVKGGDPLRNPRFKFLAGVFQIHPREFLERKLISQETYQAVMSVFEQ